MDAFVTAFYAVLHRPTGRLRYVRAAQDKPLWLRPGKRPVSLSGDGRFLGMIDGLILQEHEIILQSGDKLLLFSDGVPDQLNERDEVFGLERLKDAFLEASGDKPEGRLSFLTHKIEQWRGAAPAFDDVTMLLVEALGA